MVFFYFVFAMPLYVSVYLCLVVTCWERADLLALVCGVKVSNGAKIRNRYNREFVTFLLVSLVRCDT